MSYYNFITFINGPISTKRIIISCIRYWLIQSIRIMKSIFPRSDINWFRKLQLFIFILISSDINDSPMINCFKPGMAFSIPSVSILARHVPGKEIILFNQIPLEKIGCEWATSARERSHLSDFSAFYCFFNCSSESDAISNRFIFIYPSEHSITLSPDLCLLQCKLSANQLRHAAWLVGSIWNTSWQTSKVRR